MKKDAEKNLIFLIGFMGSGKTTVGRIAAEKCGLPFFDTDALLEERLGMSIPLVFDQKGEAFFRAEESAVLMNFPELLHGKPAVISCGGGIVLSPGNRKIMQGSGVIIYISVSPETVLERLAGDDSRPLLIGKSAEDVHKMMADREPLYREASDHTVITDGKTPEEVAYEIISLLQH